VKLFPTRNFAIIKPPNKLEFDMVLDSKQFEEFLVRALKDVSPPAIVDFNRIGSQISFKVQGPPHSVALALDAFLTKGTNYFEGENQWITINHKITRPIDTNVGFVECSLYPAR